MGAPIVHFEIMGKNGKNLQTFYGKLFDWEIDANNPMQYGLAKASKATRGIDGGIGTTENEGHPYVTVYAEVDDTDAYLKKVEKLGGKVIVPTTVIPNMVTFALFSDPEGNIVGLVKAEK